MAFLLFSVDSHGLEAHLNPNSLLDSFSSKPGTLARVIKKDDLIAFSELLSNKKKDVTYKYRF